MVGLPQNSTRTKSQTSQKDKAPGKSLNQSQHNTVETDKHRLTRWKTNVM